MKSIAIIGAGGFAREVAWLIREINRAKPSFDFRGFIVSDLSKVGERDSRELILGDYDWLERHRKQIDALALGIGSPAIRKKVAVEATALFPQMEWPVLMHPGVLFESASSQIGPGASLFAGVLTTANVRVGPFCAVNLACTIGHEACIGPYCMVNPTVNMAGGVELSECVLVGMGAQILQYVRVGAGATIGAGAVVTRNVPPGETVVSLFASRIWTTRSTETLVTENAAR
jgi:sugar O-acyltransferase (sialic acid O-acetyltransferase NeuD family)